MKTIDKILEIIKSDTDKSLTKNTTIDRETALKKALEAIEEGENIRESYEKEESYNSHEMVLN